MSEREHHIKVLENLLSHYKAREKCEGYYDSTLKDNVEALQHAISSLKTDLIYDNASKDDLEHEISEFLKSHTINELLEVVKYCIEKKEDTYIEQIHTFSEFLTE